MSNKNTDLKKLVILFLAYAFLISALSFFSFADVSRSWSCGSGLSCTDGDCGWRYEIYFNNLDLSFNSPDSGDHSCTIRVYENDYGYHDHDPAAPQLQEYSDIYLNGIYLGRTIDGGCNDLSCGYGCSCRDCKTTTTTISEIVSLKQGTNVLRLNGWQSHGVYYVSISCQKLCVPSSEICDGLDNDCDGLVDEGNVCGECSAGNTEIVDCGNTNNTGVCSYGQQNRTCLSNGLGGGIWSSWSQCTGAVYSSSEICDGLDNDCDGLVDEGRACAPDFDVKAEADNLRGSLPLEVYFCAKPIGGEAPFSYAWDFNGDGVIDSTKQCSHYTYYSVGEHVACVNATDSWQTNATDCVTVSVFGQSSSSRDNIFWYRFDNNEKAIPCGTLPVIVDFENIGHYDINDAVVTFFSAELGMHRKLGPFVLEPGKRVVRQILLDVPCWANSGSYDLRATISNGDYKRVKYRVFKVGSS